ncbi:MAG TPA: DEAD/DEAH box helicase, partial [Verrucomicrobiae bacterium]|nr:DEAD/DEAH box helicase [Verrucomicrobiae bacterium]
MNLPVEEVIPELLQRLSQGHAAVLEAPPGAGKTTLVPLALLDSVPRTQRILMLEPRRLAALSAARRMASLLGEPVGETVGYAMRYDRCVSPRTRIEVVTEGILTRRLQNDPSLDGVGVVIFDEFHERNLQSDLALALCREAQSVLRPDLKILVMSATLEVEPLAALLGASVARSAGRMFPVELRYLEREPQCPLPETAAQGVVRALAETEGDILVFLPGYREISRCQAILRERLPQGIMLCPLHGELPLAEQERAIRPGKGRKVVLATDIAETSLTI